VRHRGAGERAIGGVVARRSFGADEEHHEHRDDGALGGQRRAHPRRGVAPTGTHAMPATGLGIGAAHALEATMQAFQSRSASRGPAAGASAAASRTARSARVPRAGATLGQVRADAVAFDRIERVVGIPGQQALDLAMFAAFEGEDSTGHSACAPTSPSRIFMCRRA
jgi:hypothetical protein